MGQYCALDQVRIRLEGKVRFDPTGKDENKVSYALAGILIAEAESQLEQDLSPRYAAPFQNKNGGNFSTLPLTTRNLLRNLAELMSCIRILETDFGRGTIAEADKYVKKIQDRYDGIVAKILKTKKEEDYRNWLYPPLDSLLLAYHNTESDDGFSGQVLLSNEPGSTFPATRINDPSQNYWNAELEDGPPPFKDGSC